tara:strand:+ start:347 stop:475 length:129 start_codon:yes stop_codon:yes gene_type:complete
MGTLNNLLINIVINAAGNWGEEAIINLGLLLFIEQKISLIKS